MKNNKFYSLSANGLIATSGIVWLIAGVNILRLGIISYLELDSIPFYYYLLSVVVFIPFGLMFKRMTEKHTRRNRGYQEKMPIWYFFDKKSYAIMVFMMTFGILLRKSGVVSNDFIGVFYSGLGLALLLAGLLLIYNSISEK